MHYKYVQGVNMLRFSIVPMEGSGTNEKPPALKRVRGSISAVLSDINKSSNHRFGSCQGVNMLRFLHSYLSRIISMSDFIFIDRLL